MVIDGRENNVSNLIITIKELFLSEGLKLSVRIISELIPLPPMTKRDGDRTMARDNACVETHLDCRQVEVPIVKFTIQSLGKQTFGVLDIALSSTIAL